MSLDKQKEKLSLKIDERKAKFEEKKEQAKINRKEKELDRKAKRVDKKISSHIEKALNKVYKAEDEADEKIIILLDAVDNEIEEDEEKPIEFIVFKAQNKLEEILLETQLKIQKAKNELIKNLEKDMEKVAELVSIEEDIESYQAEMDEVLDLLDEKIKTEKETLEIEDLKD